MIVVTYGLFNCFVEVVVQVIYDRGHSDIWLIEVGSWFRLVDVFLCLNMGRVGEGQGSICGGLTYFSPLTAFKYH